MPQILAQHSTHLPLEGDLGGEGSERCEARPKGPNVVEERSDESQLGRFFPLIGGGRRSAVVRPKAFTAAVAAQRAA